MRALGLVIVVASLSAAARAQLCEGYGAARGTFPEDQGWFRQIEPPGPSVVEVVGGVLHQSTLPFAEPACGMPSMEEQAGYWFVAGEPFDFEDGISFDLDLRVLDSEYTTAPCTDWPAAGVMLTLIDAEGRTFVAGFGSARVFLANDLRATAGSPSVVEADLDTTTLRSYRLRVDGPLATLLVDGAPLLSLDAYGDPFPAATNFVWFGDGTTWANSDFETPRFRVATPGCCRADLDGDGVLTIFDFLAFQNLFDAGDLAADFDGDGELTIFDFLAFQNAFDAGCS
ncbi:MAG: GC-type dockerin domain-anchored protein [Phycisphaerales bacterium]|jgi:hypothetical protein